MTGQKIQPRKNSMAMAMCAVTAITTSIFAIGCGPAGAPPQWAPLEDQVAAVGTEFVLVVSASDPEGEELVYSFSSDAPDVFTKARISRLAVGGGEFRWTPTAEDIGVWAFDFTATDGEHRETTTIQIEVRSAVGANTAPRFIRPDGMGTTLNLGDDNCVELEIQIDDSDTSKIEISEGNPKIEKATLQVEGPQSAIWRWCPSVEQIAADDRYTLKLTADDDDNPKIVHPYLIVLRKPVKQNCPGGAPVVTHTPADISSLAGLKFNASVSDGEGLRREPLFYYSTTQPTTPIDLSAMTQLTMSLVSGDMRTGNWTVNVPNPVASEAVGTSKRVYYVIVADDDDDPEGDCDHVSQTPIFEANVTNPGGDGGTAICEPCTQDIQCGGSDDLCVRVGNGSSSFCLESCSSDSECGTDYICSPSPIESVNGATGRQCIPKSNDCSNPAGDTCDDDDREDNDTHFDAFFKPLFPPGSENLMSCPDPDAESEDDEDWIEIELEAEGTVTLELNGTDASDLDLALYDDDFVEVARSGSLDSSEGFSLCLEPGFYAVRVFAFRAAENPYTLTYGLATGACGAADICEPDANEEDDNETDATFIASLPHTATAMTSCEGDEDWYDLYLTAGTTLTVDLTFEQDDGNGDLDIHIVDALGNDLTPCSPQDVNSCATTNGQSGTSNEHLERVTTDTDVYYVMVKGFDASDRNDYSISISEQ